MSLIKVTNLTFAYEGSYDDVFTNVSFQIDTDWKLGFTGRNGRGKTTFLQLLMGKYSYQGSIAASVDFAYFPFEVADPSRSALEVAEAICPDLQLWALERELSLLDWPLDRLDQRYDTLSSGEQTKLLLATLFCKENAFLLIDEPTNHLDAEARRICGDYLAGKRGFILVSHDRRFLDASVDHILSINKANIEIQKGNFSSWWENKRRQDEAEFAENEKLKKDIKRLEEAAQRTSRWSDAVEATKIGQRTAGLKPDRGAIGHKAAKMMKRSKSIEARQQAAIEEKEGLLKNIDYASSLKISPIAHPNRRLVHFQDVSIRYGEVVACRDVRFSIEQGDRVAIVGRNGSGKSSLLKCIVGEDIDASGEISIASRLVTSYVAQDTSFLTGNLRAYAKDAGIDESLFKTILRKLDFQRAQFDIDMKGFSEGQKKKVLIARSLCEKAHLYVWDEPLNFIDVLSRMQIEELLCAHQPTMVFVEHDASFVDAIATKRVLLP